MIDRATILQEPGLLVFGGQHIYSKAEITAEFVEETGEIPSDAFGVLDNRPIDRRIEIKMTPVGELEALSVLYPHGGLLFGQSPFGSTDSAATIFTPSGKSLTVHNAAVTKMPDLTLGHKNTLFGEVVITGLLKNLTNPHAADSYYTWAASGATYPGDASFSAAAIKTLGYKAAWGASSPWSEFYTEEGFKITFNSTFDPSPADGHGTIDMRLSGLTVEATATPVGLSPANVLGRLKFQGAGNELGGTKAGGDHLVITNQVGASQLYFLLSAPTLKQSPVRFGSKVRGVGELVWSSTRTMTAGSPDPLFYLGTAAP